MHLILHIGPYKTGSTSIQLALDQGRDALIQQRCLYYRSEIYRDQSLSTRYLSSKNMLTPSLARTFKTQEQAKEWSETCWQEFEHLAQSMDVDTAILSSEQFAGLVNPAPMIERLRKSFDQITVLFYVRDPVALYASVSQEMIRSGRRFTDLPVLSKNPFNARKQIQRYIDLVGVENCIVRNFTRSNLVGEDVVVDFLDTVSQISKPISVPTAFANEGYSGAAIAWLLTVNETYDRAILTDERQRLKRRIKKSEMLKPLPKIKMTDSDLENIIRQNAKDDCQWFNEVFLQNQEKLKVPTEEIPPFTTDPDVIQARVRDWLLSYLTPEAVPLIAREIIQTKKPKSI